MTICDELAAEFPQLADEMREREALGLARYGQPLDPHADKRAARWGAECREELLDAIVYMTAELHVLARRKRFDPDAMLAYRTILQVRHDTARAVMRLRAL